MTFFLDAAPIAGGAGVVAGLVFFLVLAAAAFVAFKMLKKTVKMAFRLIIVGVILVVAAVGTVSFFWLGRSSPSRPVPARAK